MVSTAEPSRQLVSSERFQRQQRHRINGIARCGLCGKQPGSDTHASDLVICYRCLMSSSSSLAQKCEPGSSSRYQEHWKATEPVRSGAHHEAVPSSRPFDADPVGEACSTIEHATNAYGARRQASQLCTTQTLSSSSRRHFTTTEHHSHQRGRAQGRAAYEHGWGLIASAASQSARKQLNPYVRDRSRPSVLDVGRHDLVGGEEHEYHSPGRKRRKAWYELGVSQASLN